MNPIFSERKISIILLSALLVLTMGLVACSPDDLSTNDDQQLVDAEKGGDSEEGDLAAIDRESIQAELKVLTPWTQFATEFEDLFADFNKEYPNINIQLMEQTTAELAALVTANQIPDLIVGQSKEWIDKGLLEDLTSYIENEPDIRPDIFYEAAYESYAMLDGTIYNLPWQVEPNFGLMYHPDILEDYGIFEFPEISSLQEMDDFLNQFWVAEEGEQVLTTFYPHEMYGAMNTILTWAYANGAVDTTFYDPARRTIRFNDPLIVEAVEWMMQFKREHIDDQRIAQLHATLPEGVGVFQAKKSVLEAHTTPTLRENFAQNKDFAFAPMMAESLWLGGCGVGLFSTSENKDAAWELLKWMTATQAGAESLQNHFGWISGLMDNPYLEKQAQEDPVTGVAYEILQLNPKSIPAIPVDFEEELNTKWAEVLKGSLEPKAFLEQMTDHIQTLVDELAE